MKKIKKFEVNTLKKEKLIEVRGGYAAQPCGWNGWAKETVAKCDNKRCDGAYYNN